MFKPHARTFVWQFAHPPERIWQALADTQRFNEAAGLPKHLIREVPGDGGAVRFFAEARKGPFALAWEEVPVEWVAPRWFRHRRLFSRGPIGDLCATVYFEADGAGGCTCRYLLEATARTLIGELLLRTFFFVAAGRDFTRLAADVRAWADGARAKPFSPPVPPLTDAGRARLTGAVARIAASANSHGLAGRLGELLATAQEVDVMHMRPLGLAREWGADPLAVTEMMLQAVRDGVLESRWSLLCPRCRGAKLSAVSLDRLPEAAHCPSCNVDYDREFSRNVELSFRPASAIRPVADGEFCLFGPLSTPHVAAQITVQPGAVREEPADIPPGTWRCRTLERGGVADFDLGSGDGMPTVVLDGEGVALGAAAGPGRLRAENRGSRPRTLVIESREWVADALTAREVTSLQAFRDLFGGDVLRPGDNVGVSAIALMFTDVRGSTALYESAGDAAAYAIVRAHFAFLTDVVRRHSGAVVKTIGDAVMASFAVPADALAAAIEMQCGIAAFNAGRGGTPIEIKIGLHAGPCIAVTLNDRIDYFGTVVNMAARLQDASVPGGIVLSLAMADDPGVASLLEGRLPVRDTRPIRGFEGPVTFLRLGGPFTV